MENIHTSNTRESIETLYEDVFFEQLRKTEFARLDEHQHVYLDFTGGNLYPQSLIEQHCAFLKSQVLGNPHSGNPSSLLSTRHVQEAREKILSFFRAEEDYYCVFTANASAALQIVGECYPFSSESIYLLSADDHNSVNGIREYCKLRGGQTVYAPLNVEDLLLNTDFLEKELQSHADKKEKLFAFPAQSNVSGIKHSLDWIAKAQGQGWDVLLDAAAYVPTAMLDLSVVKPDFVCMSFYKIFGYPTGIGCLLVRKDKFAKLKKPWFAGGTVKLVTVNVQGHVLTEDHERFENGTLDYLNIPAVRMGLEYIEGIGRERIARRVKELTAYLIRSLGDLKHSSGEPLVHIFGSTDLSGKGGTVIFNIKDTKGNHYFFEEVETRANAHNISLRTGCFCNPGIDEINHCISNEELAAYYFVSAEKRSYTELIAALKKIRGAVRVSVGIATVRQDIDALIDFVNTFRE